jgi:hypothetical protein
LRRGADLVQFLPILPDKLFKSPSRFLAQRVISGEVFSGFLQRPLERFALALYAPFKMR